MLIASSKHSESRTFAASPTSCGVAMSMMSLKRKVPGSCSSPIMMTVSNPGRLPKREEQRSVRGINVLEGKKNPFQTPRKIMIF